METRQKLVLKLLAVGLLAVTAVAGSSFAQSMSNRQNGSFTLPFEAHWGTLDLKPAAYSFSVADENGFHLVRVKRNNQQIGVVVATTFGAAETSGQSNGELLCAHHSGTAVIAALDMPSSGVYQFYVPRGTTISSVAQANPKDVVPVLLAQR